MTPLLSLSRAMLKGFFRDRMAFFFSIVFPLMFLVLFGGIFTNDGASRADIIQVGQVSVLDRAPKELTYYLDESLEITKSSDLKDAVEQVRKGDADAVVSQDGDRLVLRYSQADQVVAATLQGTFQSIIQTANLAATGQPPKFSLRTDQVEDDSLEAIQYYTPGLMGWAIASGATFGAATNLVAWRKNGLLRRLRLAPVPTSSVVVARVAVSIAIALVQAVIFLGVGVAFFGLRLTGSWPMIIPLLICGTLAFMAIGLLAGAVARTEEAAVGIANFVVLPMAFLSGSFFSLDGAPGYVTAVSKVLPLKHLNQGMLDTMVRGEGPSSALVPMAILLGFAIVLTAVASRLFRWDR
ncbi:ABC transporter permease [Aeromicrobium wangtongii]|uniref:ABC transporter permease n=1 Tax=Aeromicrobium wangtongii TaxID=2969247 RepID=A0ABY5M564_9ACTN|nr:ABC transporter permease [Aeromicrobium wangtongii]MCD9200051.1 ABC transporter permease [Aeromicrobium wangtongii]UUP13309.1 ABC transporter permease [Aeromicrobium wangtongii]